PYRQTAPSKQAPISIFPPKSPHVMRFPIVCIHSRDRLYYLRRYPADRIKIPHAFIANIGIVLGNDAIVRAILNLARELGMEVVVEGVETAAQLELLKSWGCA